MQVILSATTLLLTAGLFGPAGREAAYLDPGSGSFILQLIIASAVGALFVFRGYLARIANIFRRSDTEEEESEDTPEDGK